MQHAFSALLKVIGSYKKRDGNDFSRDTIDKMQTAQQQLSEAIINGVRNPLSHEEISDLKESDLFSEKDCLDLLSLLSHLFKRLDNSVKINP